MTRSFALIVAVYLPHLVEEALTRMHDEPMIAAALSPLTSFSTRHAAYLMFQVVFALALVMVTLVSAGGRALALVLGALALALVCESHHLVRALFHGAYNSGLITSLPMPIVGALVLGALARQGSSRIATQRPTGELASRSPS